MSKKKSVIALAAVLTAALAVAACARPGGPGGGRGDRICGAAAGRTDRDGPGVA